MPSETTELFKNIAASLWVSPATIEELSGRDFLKFRSEIGVSNLLHAMVNLGWIYQRGERFFTYKQTVIKNLSEYEIL